MQYPPKCITSKDKAFAQPSMHGQTEYSRRELQCWPGGKDSIKTTADYRMVGQMANCQGPLSFAALPTILKLAVTLILSEGILSQISHHR